MTSEQVKLMLAWTPERIAQAVYEESGGKSDWRTPPEPDGAVYVNGRWHPNGIQTPARQRLEKELESNIRDHPAGKGMTPAVKLPGSMVRRHSPRIGR